MILDEVLGSWAPCKFCRSHGGDVLILFIIWILLDIQYTNMLSRYHTDNDESSDP